MGISIKGGGIPCEVLAKLMEVAKQKDGLTIPRVETPQYLSFRGGPKIKGGLDETEFGGVVKSFGLDLDNLPIGTFESLQKSWTPFFVLSDPMDPKNTSKALSDNVLSQHEIQMQMKEQGCPTDKK